MININHLGLGKRGETSQDLLTIVYVLHQVRIVHNIASGSKKREGHFCFYLSFIPWFQHLISLREASLVFLIIVSLAITVSCFMWYSEIGLEMHWRVFLLAIRHVTADQGPQWQFAIFPKKPLLQMKVLSLMVEDDGYMWMDTATFFFRLHRHCCVPYLRKQSMYTCS